MKELNAEVDKIEISQTTILRARNIQDEEQRDKVISRANQDWLEAIAKVTRLVRTGVKEWYIWTDIINLVENRRRLVETERRLLVDMQRLVDTEDVMILLDALMDSVKSNVSDRDTRKAIQSDFLRLTAR